MNASKTMKSYLELARKEALDSYSCQQKHGAVLVRGGSVLNKSCNNPNFSSFMSRFAKLNPHKIPKATRHAELMCVLGLDRSVTQGTTIYVVRINGSGKFMMSKPCELCQDVLRFVGVRKAIYTINEHRIGILKL